MTLFLKIAKILGLITLIISEISCDDHYFRESDSPIIISLSDSLVLDYSFFDPLDQPWDGTTYSYYESPYLGFLDKTGVYRLKLVYDSVSPNPDFVKRIIFKPILTGETRVVLKSKTKPQIVGVNTEFSYTTTYVVITK